MKKLLLAMLMVALIAMPAFASVQNVKVSGYVNSTYALRQNFDFRGEAAHDGDQYQSIMFSQTGLEVNADLTDQVSATIAIVNERVWGEQSVDGSGIDAGDDFNVHLAFVTLREMLYSPLTVIVGRQEFGFGNNLIFATSGAGTSVANSGLANAVNDMASGSLDAVRLVLDYNPLTITAFWAPIDANSVAEASSSNDDNIDVVGLYSTYELGDEMNSVVEAYVFKKVDQTTNTVGNLVQKNDVVKVVGLRGATNILDGLNVSLEYAHQSGTYSDLTNNFNQTRDAHAVQLLTSYAIPESLLPEALAKYNPVLEYQFSKFTGADASNAGNNDDTYAAWNPFFEDQSNGTILNVLFSLSNCYVNTIALTVNPIEDVTSKLMVTKLWTEKDWNATSIALGGPDGGSNTVATKTGKNGLGVEVDWMTTYNYTEDVQLGLNVGVYQPGNLFVEDVSAKQVLAHINVAF